MEAQTKPRPAARPRQPRPATASGLLDSVTLYNPYVLPADRTPKGWAFWGIQAVGLSLTATLIWDRAPHISSSKGGFMQASAQWVSALVLLVAAAFGAVALGAPWGGLPLVAGVVIGLRRILAAEGKVLGLDAALAGATRKFVLASAGIATWFGSVAIAGWLNDVLGKLSGSPLGRMGGESVSLSTAGDRLIGLGSIACMVLVTVSMCWWARDTYLNHMDPAPL